jgi:hypothetical protein
MGCTPNLEAASNAKPEPMNWRRRICFSSQELFYAAVCWPTTAAHNGHCQKVLSHARQTRGKSPYAFERITGSNRTLP